MWLVYVITTVTVWTILKMKMPEAEYDITDFISGEPTIYLAASARLQQHEVSRSFHKKQTKLVILIDCTALKCTAHSIQRVMSQEVTLINSCSCSCPMLSTF